MRHILLHGHIFKNAGTTLDWSLQRTFGDGFLDHRDDKAMRERRRRHLADLVATMPSLRALSSHFLCCPLPEIAGIRFHDLRLLRHPIERMASVYAFERQQDAATPGAQAAKTLDFTDYVRWRLRDDVPRTIRSYQVANITGNHDYPLGGPAPDAWAHEASARIAAMACVGVVDRYDESMVVFEAVLSPWFPAIDLAYVRQNVTQSDPDRPLALRVAETLERLGAVAGEALALNGADLALYEQANRQLDDALAALDDVDGRLRAFRERCASLQGDGG